MPLVTMKEILTHASVNNYGVGAFNLLSMEAVKGAVRAAEELNSPLIMQLAEVQLPDSPMEYMIPMMVQAAKSSSVPVAVHFDHGMTFEVVIKALKYGCTSVMYDGAALSFSENVAKTLEIANIAHAMGANCEAELGIVGGAEAGSHDLPNGGSGLDDLLTDPRKAMQFVEESKCDFLAVAIGNAHGPYIKEPRLSFDRLKEIDELVDVPLVLHGGSGIDAESFRKSISLGIRKINVATALQENILEKIGGVCGLCHAKKLTYSSLTKLIEAGVYEEVKEHMLIFQSDGKANYQHGLKYDEMIDTIASEVLKRVSFGA